MAPALSPFFRDSSFDRFLYAAVGEERNGMLLSVLSALARLDLDPWFEAANLSRLSSRAATERLTALLSSLPASQLKAPAAATIARLLTLLPQPATEAAWSRGAAVLPRPRTGWPMMGLIFVALVMMFAEQIAEQGESRRPSGGVASPASSTIDPGAANARGE